MPNKKKTSKLFTNALAKGKLSSLPQVKDALRMMSEKRARDTEDIDFNFDESKVRGFDKLSGEDAQDKKMRKSMLSGDKKRKSQAEIELDKKREAKRQKRAANLAKAAAVSKDAGDVIVPKSSKKNKYFFMAHPDKLEKHKAEEIQAISTTTNFIIDKEKIQLNDAKLKKKQSMAKKNGTEIDKTEPKNVKKAKSDEVGGNVTRPKITAADMNDAPVMDFSELGKKKFKFKTTQEKGPDGAIVSVLSFGGEDNVAANGDESTHESGSEAGEDDEAETVQENQELTSDKNEDKKEPSLVRNKMLDKLQASRFRYLNEMLYTQQSGESFKYFQNDTDAFKAYHEGFRQQVNKWPMNPIDVIIKKIQAKSSQLIIADFGCGEAKLSASVKNKVHSFDMVAVNDLVTKCDMKNVPLNNESVDIAVFSLSLMGTNVIEFLLEAHRVLKQKGVLKIAEVVSRIEDRYVFIRKVESIGFKLVINKEEEEKEKKAEYFYFFDFIKNSPAVKGKPNIQLSACLYKKR